MKIAFIGGYGHHYLIGALSDASIGIERPVAYVPTCDADRAPARRLTEPADKIKVFDDLDSMFREYQPDVVNVGAIYARNGDYACEALQRDIPVVSDKPIAATWEQLARVKTLARKHGKPVLSEFDFRSRQEFRAARDAVKQGLIGEPVLATAQKSYRFGTRPEWYADRAQYGGTMLWIASHSLDAVRFVTGKEIKAVSGRGGNLSQPNYDGMEDHCAAILQLENGGTGIVHADFLRPQQAPTHGDDRLRVAGSKGVLEVRDRRCMLITHDTAEKDITESVEVQPIHREMLASLQGEHSDLYSTEESLKTAELLLHARDAADKQEWIRIP